MNPIDLTGKVALITGSGRGLGYTMAKRLAELGAKVAIHDRSQEAPAQYGEWKSLEDAARSLDAIAVVGDIGDEESTRRMAGEVTNKLGRIDVLVNCAGGDIGSLGTKPNPNGALDISIDDARAIIDRNFVGTMLMCRAVVPGMVERKQGSVVNIASSAAHSGGSPEVVYACMKAAIVHYTRCLAKETRPFGVRVNAVSPGPTKTARFVATRSTDPEMMTEGESLIRYVNPIEIANGVAFLASDAASMVHGQVLRIDGGITLSPG